MKKELEQIAEALLHAHGTIDELVGNEEHDGALYCSCETAVAYRLAVKLAQGG